MVGIGPPAWEPERPFCVPKSMVFSPKALEDPEVILKSSGVVVNASLIKLAHWWKSRFESAQFRGKGFG
jgi:hypothetical protein